MKSGNSVAYPKARSVACLALLAIAALSGCTADDPLVAPDTPLPNEGFVPLQVGNTWTSTVTQTTVTTYLDGNPSPPPNILELTAERRIVATERFSEEVYAVEELTLTRGLQTAQSWTRYRQDDEGLYVAPLPTSQPPAFGSAFLIQEMPLAVEGESVELRYPLEAGSSWAVSATERAEVEGREVLEVAGGSIETYRVRIISALGGPDDYTRAWYSGCGLVRYENRQAIRAVGPGGGVVIDRLYVEELVDFALVGGGECSWH